MLYLSSPPSCPMPFPNIIKTPIFHPSNFKLSISKMKASQLNKQVSVSVSATKFGKFKDKKSVDKCNFIGVRQRPSGKWVSEIKDTTHDIRMWLGTFKTPEEAARAYDEAACLLRGANTRTNFASQSHFSSKPTLSLKIRNLLNQKINSKRSSSKSNAADPVNRSLGSSYGIVGGDVADTNQEVKMFVNEEWSSFCRGEYEMGFCQFSHLWGNFPFEMNLDEAPLMSNDALEFPREVAKKCCDDSGEFEPTLMMPMFGVNGMSEYLGNIYDVSDTVGQIFCPS